LIAPPSRVRRIVYLGTPEPAVPPLLALHRAGFEIPLVVSRADKRRGRGSATTPSPVKRAALDLGIPVTTDVDDALEVDADLGVVVAFGRLIKPHVLDRLAMVNLHFSLLPRWRGAAPVERAILAGDEATGVCVMAVEEELDTGGIYSRQEVRIDANETLDELRDRLVGIGAEMLVSALTEGLGAPEPQAGPPVYASKIDRDELRLDWSLPAVALNRVVRIGDAWTTHSGKRLKIWRSRAVQSAAALEPGQVDGVMVGTGAGRLELIEVQPEGRPRRSGREWVNGAQLGPDTRLGQL
jgi:methionyl-tRNA formyltransferase